MQTVDVNNEIKSMQEELSVLDDVRYGKLCGRCLRSDYTNGGGGGHRLGGRQPMHGDECDVDYDDDDERLTHDDDMQSFVGTEDGDDQSLLELNSLDTPTYTSSVTINVSSSCAYHPSE